jgi:translation initiation factor IF-2
MLANTSVLSLSLSCKAKFGDHQLAERENVEIRTYRVIYDVMTRWKPL